MRIEDAQRESRYEFVGGGPGALVSGLVWLVAAVVQRRQGIGMAFATLFFGGMLIFPAAKLISVGIFRRKTSGVRNELGRVALESTLAMSVGLFAAWLLLPVRPGVVLPVVAVAVGTHYAAFRTVYGDVRFWVLGGLVTAVGLLGVLQPGWISGGTALGVGSIEVICGVWLTLRGLRV